MGSRAYWLDLFTLETWQEFLNHGGEVSGFSEARWPTVQKMEPGDYLLCYLTGASRWIGVLEVVGEPFVSDEVIWSGAPYPSRLPVRVVIALPPEHGVPVLNMRQQLSVFQGLANPNQWSGPFRGSPAKWKPADGEAVVTALQDAQANPVARPFKRTRSQARTTAGAATGDDQRVVVPNDEDAPLKEEAAPSAHTEMQYLLLRLGAYMDFDVYVASNDQSRLRQGQRLGDVPRRREVLPQRFDEATNQTIERIDVLWLENNAMVAAFEIESTTSIYSGLLRMSDLLSCQPNISVPLFVVAPGERRSKVTEQVNRPTFARLKPPLVEVCRYIAFEELRSALDELGDHVRYLRPEWLQAVSESCALEDS